MRAHGTRWSGRGADLLRFSGRIPPQVGAGARPLGVPSASLKIDGAGKGLKIVSSCVSLGLNPRMGERKRTSEGGAFSRSGHGRPETLVASAVLGRPLCAVDPVNSGVRVVSLVDLLVMTTRATLRAAFGAVIPGASTHQVWGPGVRGIPASFAPKSLACRWKGDDASPGGGHDSMRGLPEMRTPIVEEQSIPATEDELAKRRAAALRAWLEREMGTERAALPHFWPNTV